MDRATSFPRRTAYTASACPREAGDLGHAASELDQPRRPEDGRGGLVPWCGPCPYLRWADRVCLDPLG